MIQPWATEYIGIPWTDRGRSRDGVDCYGLVYLVLKEQFGINVPSYAEDYATARDAEEVGALIRAGIRSVQWERIEASQTKAGDVAMINQSGEPYHPGIVLDPPFFLNVLEGTAVALDKWTIKRWNRRMSFYRYVG